MCSLVRSGSDDGFTLLEVLVVMALLSLAAVMGALWLPDVGDRIVLARTASQLEQSLARLSADALQTGLDRSAVIARDGATQTFQIGGAIDRLDASISLSWIASVEAGSDRDQGKIIFFGTGGATGGKLELTRGNARAAVDIDWLTANVRTSW